MIPPDEQQTKDLERLRRRFDISLIVAFGSRVRGVVHPDSDLDLGVLYGGKVKRLEVGAELQRIFPACRVDVATLNRADPLLLNEVNRSCRLLCGDAGEFDRFRLYAFHRYQDFKPYLKLEAQTNAARLAGLINAAE